MYMHVHVQILLCCKLCAVLYAYMSGCVSVSMFLYLDEQSTLASFFLLLLFTNVNAGLCISVLMSTPIDNDLSNS